MARELPYLASYKNVGALFQKIYSAKVPESFTQKFLHDTIGLKASGDRPLISLLKQLGFLDGNGKPTSRYSALKNENVAGIEIARGIREAYRPLYDANENAHNLSLTDLKGLVAQVSGADSGTASKIVGTFRALLKVADFESESILNEDGPENEKPDIPVESSEKIDQDVVRQPTRMRPEFHYNIQVHLPSNGTEETYINIFNAIRKVFQ